MPVLPDFLKNIPEIKLDEAKKKILLIYAGALLLVLAGYFFFFLKPNMAKLSELFPKITERKVSVKSIQDDLLHENKLKEKLSSLEEKLGGYEKSLSREKEIPVLLENLSETAKKSGVKILSIIPDDSAHKTQPDKEGRVYQEVPITVSARSGYHELGLFINRLENDKRYMQVSHMKITPNPSNSKKHNIEFVVYAYTFKQ